MNFLFSPACPAAAAPRRKNPGESAPGAGSPKRRFFAVRRRPPARELGPAGAPPMADSYNLLCIQRFHGIMHGGPSAETAPGLLMRLGIGFALIQGSGNKTALPRRRGIFLNRPGVSGRSEATPREPLAESTITKRRRQRIPRQMTKSRFFKQSATYAGGGAPRFGEEPAPC
jgi:hypothetical protein